MQTHSLEDSSEGLAEGVSPARKRPWAAWLAILILSLGLFRCAVILWDGWQFLFLPFESSMPETLVLHGAQRVAALERLYPAFGQIPYLADVYNPLAYLPAGIIGHLFHLELEGIRLAGRFLSYASFLLLAVVVCWWVRREGGRWLPGILAASGVIYFAWPMLSDLFRIRPELPGLLLSCAGVALLNERSHVRIAASACLLFLSFLFKQWFIAAPIAIGLYLAITRQLRPLVLFSLVYSGLLTGFLVLAMVLTEGAYYDHAIKSMAMNDNHFVQVLLGFFMNTGLLNLYRNYTGTLLYALPVAVWMLGTQGRRFLLLLIYFACSAGWSVYSSGKFGADLNYFGELLVVSLVISALALALPVQSPAMKWGRCWIVLVLCVHILGSAFSNGLGGPRMRPIEWYDARQAERYRTMPGRILIVNEGVAVHAGKVTALDWILLDDLVKKGILKVDTLWQQIAERQYDVIVLDGNVETDLERELGERVKANYQQGIAEEWTPVGE